MKNLIFTLVVALSTNAFAAGSRTGAGGDYDKIAGGALIDPDVRDNRIKDALSAAGGSGFGGGQGEVAIDPRIQSGGVTGNSGRN